MAAAQAACLFLWLVEKLRNFEDFGEKINFFCGKRKIFFRKLALTA